MNQRRDPRRTQPSMPSSSSTATRTATSMPMSIPSSSRSRTRPTPSVSPKGSTSTADSCKLCVEDFLLVGGENLSFFLTDKGLCRSENCKKYPGDHPRSSQSGNNADVKAAPSVEEMRKLQSTLEDIQKTLAELKTNTHHASGPSLETIATAVATMVLLLQSGGSTTSLSLYRSVHAGMQAILILLHATIARFPEIRFPASLQTSSAGPLSSVASTLHTVGSVLLNGITSRMGATKSPI